MIFKDFDRVFLDHPVIFLTRPLSNRLWAALDETARPENTLALEVARKGILGGTPGGSLDVRR
jgi:hypothetical protein